MTAPNVLMRKAAEVGAQLLLTHHPLLLTGVHSVAADGVKGAMVHRMISAGVAVMFIVTIAMFESLYYLLG